jgi:hypothetical protein
MRRAGFVVSSTWALAVLAAGVAVAQQDDDLDDMRLEARAQAQAAREVAALTVGAAPGTEPATIRVWRRKLDGSTSSCTGRVDVIPFEDYVKGVVHNEWIPSWDDKALDMGAVCARTFAWWWVRAGGKYPCADVDDSAASQVYTDGRVAKTDAAVERTRGVTIVKDGALVLAEYSAENGDPTAFGVDEPYCAGQTVNGHGRGACQWGTQRWATKEGRDFRWMIAHYYPGAAALEPDSTWVATVVAPPGQITLPPGGEASVSFDVENGGSASWDAGVELATTGPSGRSSPFVAGSWLSPSVVAAVVAGAGATAHVTIALHAPAAVGQYQEAFALVRDGAVIGGDPLVTLAITVAAPDAPPDAGAPAPPGGAALGDASGGCQAAPGATSGAVWVLAGLLGLRRRSGRRAGAR